MNLKENWNKNFFTIWTGQAISQLTSSILQFAIIWHLTDTTKSGMILSIAMLMGFLPRGILGLFVGVFIDRHDKKRIMIISDVIIALACLLLPIVGYFGEIPVPLIMFVLFLRSVGTAFHEPAIQAVTPQIVPKKELTRYAGYSQTLESVTQILSPALAGILYANLSLDTIVYFDVIGAIFAVFTLYISHMPKHIPKKKDPSSNVWKESKDGFNILRNNKGIFGLVAVRVLYTLAMMPTSSLFPLMSMDYFSGTSIEASFVEILFSVGLFIGAIIFSHWGYKRNKINSIIFSYLLMTACLLTSGFLPPTGFYIFLLAAFFMGFSNPFYHGMFIPLIQQNIEEEYLGRVLSISTSISFVIAPIGLFASGIIADTLGVEKWFIIAGIITLIASLICIFSKNIQAADKSNEE